MIPRTRAPWQEATIMVNGVQLTEAQALAVRVALNTFNPDAGDDEHGKALAAAYRERIAEVLNLIDQTQR